MCGIAGIVRPTEIRADPAQLARMTDALRRRGPDADGAFVTGNVALGHRRLSIIDTASSANQPLLDETEQLVVVFNGEIYNFQELRAELEAAGHRFRTRSDTEVLLHGWRAYGVALLPRLRGMFAFALLDRRTGQLLLARDRIGKKPLYYTSASDGVRFASELKAIRAAGDTGAPELDVAALRQYVAYGCTLGERTIYEGIHRLPPASYALLDTRSARPTPIVASYLAPPAAERATDPADAALTEAAWLDRLDAVLSEAVRLRMISDVPLGAFLSGGIDSSLVAAYMTRHARRVETFAIGFAQRSHDESGYAAEVARHLGTSHRVEIVAPSAVDTLPDLIDAFDEPFADASALPTFYLCQMARRHVTVALSGDGGDEGHLGYPRYQRAQQLDQIARTLGAPGRALVRAATRLIPIGVQGRVVGERVGRGGFAAYANELGWRDSHLSLLRPQPGTAGTEADPANDPLRRAYDGAGPSALERYQATDLAHYLPDDILTKVDRTSMWHSLEVRAPLLDQDFLALSARIPIAHKLAGGDGKHLLKQLLYRHVPRALIDRPKMGFGVPLAAWFRAELRPALDEMLADRGSSMWRWFDRDVAVDRVRRHQLPGFDLSTALWRLLVFYRWSRRFT